MASEPNSPTSSLIGRLIGSAGPAVSKVRNVNPSTVKTSASHSVTGTRELLSLSVAYVKQETMEPLSGAGRLLAFGAVGATFMGFGLVLFALALLRGIQSVLAYVHADGERGPLSGTLSWVPYLLSALGCLVALGVIVALWSRAAKSIKRSGSTK